MNTGIPQRGEVFLYRADDKFLALGYINDYEVPDVIGWFDSEGERAFAIERWIQLKYNYIIAPPLI